MTEFVDFGSMSTPAPKPSHHAIRDAKDDDIPIPPELLALPDGTIVYSAIFTKGTVDGVPGLVVEHKVGTDDESSRELGKTVTPEFTHNLLITAANALTDMYGPEEVLRRLFEALLGSIDE